MKKYLLAVLLLLLSTTPAFAGGFVSLMGPSYHTEQYYDNGKKQFNNNTYGIGLGYSWNSTKAIKVGTYLNSYKKRSYYVEYDYTPIHFYGVDLGGGVGAVTGYKEYTKLNMPIIPMAGVLVRYMNVELRWLPYTGQNHIQVFNISYNIHF